MKKLKIGLNILFAVILAGICVAVIVIVSNFRYIAFAVYPANRDYMEAAIRISMEEKRAVQQKIADIHTQSVKKILSPLVVLNAK